MENCKQGSQYNNNQNKFPIQLAIYRPIMEGNMRCFLNIFKILISLRPSFVGIFTASIRDEEKKSILYIHERDRIATEEADVKKKQSSK